LRCIHLYVKILFVVTSAPLSHRLYVKILFVVTSAPLSHRLLFSEIKIWKLSEVKMTTILQI
jgi:hypothetical protein